MGLGNSVLIMSLVAAVTIDAAPGKVRSTNATTTDINSVGNAYDQAAKSNEASFVTELAFDKGSSDLSKDAKSQLKDILRAAKAGGEIAEVKVISWADREYPSNTKNLERDERKLADDRGLEIRNFIQDEGATKIETYNMAEQPDALAKLFKNSPDVKLKRSLERAGLAHPYQTQMPQKASRAMVMVILRQ